MTTTPAPYGRFFLPGPTEVKPEVLKAMTRPMIAHRGREFEALFARLQVGLRAIFRTPRPVYISTSSATGMMEAAVRSAPSGRILCLVNGAFADRFAHVARSCGREVDTVDIEWGRAADPAEVERRLGAARYSAVTVVHSETSTGALTDVKALAEVCGRKDVMLLVDSVSGVGGTPMLPHAWNVDFVFTGSQKALAIPPGLAFAVASERFVESARSQATRGTYFDIVEFEKFAEKRQTPSTPALSLLFALDAQLERIVQEGVGDRWARHTAMAERTERWTDEITDVPLGMLPPAGERSPTVSCIALPESHSGALVASTVAEIGFTIAPGYGRLKEKTIRIGHMGDHTLPELENCLAAIAQAIERIVGSG